MKPLNPPPATYNFAFRQKPRSGNEINGLGVKERVRPKVIISNRLDCRDYDYVALEDLMMMNLPWAAFREAIRVFIRAFGADGPVASARAEVRDPALMSEQIKQEARACGAGIVGITLVNDELLSYEGDEPYAYKYVICLGVPQNREIMKTAPQPTAAVEVMRTYAECSDVANKLARHIRSLGWRAEAVAYGKDTLMIPSAIQAGLGELGKHGSMICKEYGSNFRLAMVLTDLSLAIDQPVDIGVEDLCLVCQRCTTDCPPGAISDSKQMVRGVEKWYVDFDKCIYYWGKNLGCSICIEVCPWSETGRGAGLSQKLLQKRESTKQDSASTRVVATDNTGLGLAT